MFLDNRTSISRRESAWINTLVPIQTRVYAMRRTKKRWKTSLVVKPTSTSYFTTTVYTVIIAPVNKNSNIIYNIWSAYLRLPDQMEYTKNIFWPKVQAWGGPASTTWNEYLTQAVSAVPPPYHFEPLYLAQTQDPCNYLFVFVMWQVERKNRWWFDRV